MERVMVVLNLGKVNLTVTGQLGFVDFIAIAAFLITFVQLEI